MFEFWEANSSILVSTFGRKIYTRLDNLANRWTELNEVHLVHSVVFAMFSLTFDSYCVYIKYTIPDVQLYQGSLASCATYLWFNISNVIKLFMIVCPAAALTAEVTAQATQIC